MSTFNRELSISVQSDQSLLSCVAVLDLQREHRFDVFAELQTYLNVYMP